MTPWWWALWVLIKYRTARNYRDGAFIGQRLGDKITISALIFTLYLVSSGAGRMFCEGTRGIS